MGSFFVFEPAGGTALFSPLHGVWLAGCLVLCLWTGRMAARGRCAGRAVAFELLLCEGTRVLVLFCWGRLDRGYLPLHLCGAAVYACILHAARGGALTGELIYSTLAPGAAVALLFPDWLDYPPGSFLFLSSFGIHMLICAYAAAVLCSGEVRPDRRRLPRCALVLGLYALAVYVLDRLLDVNYLFLIRPAEGSPLEWAARVLPWHGLLYLPGLAIVWALLYSRPMLRAVARLRRPPGI